MPTLPGTYGESAADGSRRNCAMRSFAGMAFGFGELYFAVILMVPSAVPLRPIQNFAGPDALYIDLSHFSVEVCANGRQS